MKATWKSLILIAAMLVAAVPIASAQTAAPAAAAPQPVLLGTTGVCNNDFPGGPCTQTSTLVQIDPRTGALIRTIGPVGFTVNGLAWDPRNGKLYASTAIGDVAFHGLITINPFTGAGTPVNANVHNFGLAGADSPIHSVVINPQGQMVAWYDEFPPGAGDTFVTINKGTGIATEFNHPGGIDTHQNGLAFQAFGPLSVLWNIDGLNGNPATQTAYVINPFNGNVLVSRPIAPPMMAALGDFNPVNFLYYGLEFTAFGPTTTFINVIDPIRGTAKRLAQTVDNLHVLAFVKH
jgi:hypothetical protein